MADDSRALGRLADKFGLGPDAVRRQMVALIDDRTARAREIDRLSRVETKKLLKWCTKLFDYTQLSALCVSGYGCIGRVTQAGNGDSSSMAGGKRWGIQNDARTVLTRPLQGRSNRVELVKT